MPPEPIHDIAHLGHVEIFTPKFVESRKFFIDVMGMTQSGEKGSSVYLRCWDDYERYSLKLTDSKTSGLGHAAFRTRSPQALERRAAALKGSGFDVGWTDGDLGHGKSFMCKDPDGHMIELYYDTEWYDPPPDQKPALKNQAQRYPARGINARRIDHFNGLAVDIKANREFFQNYLGFMLTEQIVLDDGSEAGMWMTATNKYLGDIAELGLTLPEAKQLLASVQRAVVSAQAVSHGLQRPCCSACSGKCHLKDWRGHHIATLFGAVTVTLRGFDDRLQSHRDERWLAIALPIDT